jgi:hypothetical protein
MTLTEWAALISPWFAILALILWDTRLKAGEEERSAPERKRFLRRHDGFDVVNLAVLASTFLAAALAAYEAGRLADLTDELVRDGQATATQQAEFTRESNRLNREALIASSRAWVGPVDAKISGGVELAKGVKIVVSVRNTGKEPARNFRWIPTHIIATNKSLNDGSVSHAVDTNLKFCFGTPATTFGQVIFPSTGFGSGADFSIEFPKEEIDEEVISGAKILVAEGCIAYATFGEVRHSAFCYYFKSGLSSLDHLNICDGGSNAD